MVVVHVVVIKVVVVVVVVAVLSLVFSMPCVCRCLRLVAACLFLGRSPTMILTYAFVLLP